MSIPLRRDFIQFQTALEAVADDWMPLSESETRAKAMTPYQLMAERVIDSVAFSAPDIHFKLANNNARHGALVLGRYCNIAALLGNKEGFDMAGLKATMENPTTFATIADIASVESDVAVKIENVLGIRGYYTEDELVKYKLRHWQLDDTNAVTVPDMQTIAYESAMQTINLDLTRKHECAALSNRMLDKIYGQFTRICLQDPLLFERTLSTEYDFASHHSPVVRGSA